MKQLRVGYISRAGQMLGSLVNETNTKNSLSISLSIRLKDTKASSSFISEKSTQRVTIGK